MFWYNYIFFFFQVDWDNEQQCFHDFAFELSHFYSTGEDSSDTASTIDNEQQHSSVDDSEEQKEWHHKVEHVLFPALRSYLIPPKRFSTDGTFLEVANLPDLYKVFERCWKILLIELSPEIWLLRMTDIQRGSESILFFKIWTEIILFEVSKS